MKETLRHRDAFEYYYSLGEKRNFGSVAIHCGCTNRAIANWSKSFQWQHRIEERDREIGFKVDAKMKEKYADRNSEYLELINEILRRFIAKVEKEPNFMLIKDASDLERIIKIHLLLTGKYTDSKQITLEGKMSITDLVKKASTGEEIKFLNVD